MSSDAATCWSTGHYWEWVPWMMFGELVYRWTCAKCGECRRPT